MQGVLFSADWVFTGKEWKQNVIMHFEDGTFVRCYENFAELPEGLKVKHFTGILCPGFVNAHCHLELSHLRGMISKGKGLSGFIRELQSVRHHQMDHELRLQAMHQADEAMFLNGIQAVGDISNGIESIEVKAVSNITYHTFVEAFGIRKGEENGILKRSVDIANEFKRKLNAQRVSVVPHALYSTSGLLVSWLLNHPANMRQPVCIHFMEDFAEEEFLTSGRGPFRDLLESFGIFQDSYNQPGLGSPELLMKLAPHRSKILLVHALHLSKEAWNVIYSKHPNAYLVLCPSANRYISNSLPDARMFASDRICLGTDSLASNDALDLMQEMKWIGKQGLTLRTMLPWVTQQPAEALNLSDCCGSFIANKNTGLLNIKHATPDSLPDHAYVKRIY